VQADKNPEIEVEIRDNGKKKTPPGTCPKRHFSARQKQASIARPLLPGQHRSVSPASNTGIRLAWDSCPCRGKRHILGHRQILSTAFLFFPRFFFTQANFGGNAPSIRPAQICPSCRRHNPSQPFSLLHYRRFSGIPWAYFPDSPHTAPIHP